MKHYIFNEKTKTLIIPNPIFLCFGEEYYEINQYEDILLTTISALETILIYTHDNIATILYRVLSLEEFQVIYREGEARFSKSLCVKYEVVLVTEKGYIKTHHYPMTYYDDSNFSLSYQVEGACKNLTRQIIHELGEEKPNILALFEIRISFIFE